MAVWAGEGILFAALLIGASYCDIRTRKVPDIYSMGSVLRLLAEKPRILYIAATDGRYGGAMAVGDGIRGVRAEQRFLDISTPLAKWSEVVREFHPNMIIGYPSAVKILAELSDREKEPLHVEGLTEAVQEAYTSNLDDTWGVDVYFWITKTLE